MVLTGPGVGGNHGPGSGSVGISPTETATYTGTVVPGGQPSCSATVTVTVKVNGACNPEPDTHWSCAPGSTSANNIGGSAGPWTWNCNGSNGGTNASCSQPATPAGAPTCTFSASPSTITSGNSTTLSWTTSANATSFVIDGIGNVGAGSGTRTVTPTTSMTYTGTARAGAATGACSTSVTVNTAPPTVNGSCNPEPDTHWSCAPGSTSADNIGGSAGPWTWNCNGSNGGTNASCSQPATPAGTPPTCTLSASPSTITS